MTQYKRQWDGAEEYIRWEADGIWTVEDLNPEHDDLAVELMNSVYVIEEAMCKRSGFSKSKEMLEGCKQFWKELAAERVSLACYRHHGGDKELVALNMCTVKYTDDQDEELPDDMGPEVLNLIYAINYISNSSDFNSIGIKQYLCGCGLFVLPKFRGSGIGGKILEARKPMCKLLGIPASGTIFTSVASQKLAERAGFKTALKISFGELSDAGFHFPGDPEPILKMMYIIYD